MRGLLQSERVAVRSVRHCLRRQAIVHLLADVNLCTVTELMNDQHKKAASTLKYGWEMLRITWAGLDSMKVVS